MSKYSKSFSKYLDKSSKCLEISRILNFKFPQRELKSLSEIVYTSSAKEVQAHCFQHPGPPFWQMAASDMEHIFQVRNRYTGLRE